MINGYLYPLLDKMHMTYYDFITHFDQIENKLPERHSKFPTLDIPATIIRWAHDKILVWEEQAPVLADLFDIADTDVHLLDTAAHFIQEEVPEEIVELIDGFVKRR